MILSDLHLCKKSSRACAFLVFCQLYILLIFIQSQTYYIVDPDDEISRNSVLKQVQFYPKRELRHSSSKLILVWTPMFFSWGWIYWINTGLDGCSSNCRVTTNRTKIKEADAILFHIYDVWFWTEFPTYRHPSQVWVIWGAEPTTRLWKIYHAYKNVFNWTMMYRLDSTIFAPFGRFKRLNDSELKNNKKYLKSRTLFKERKHFVAITNSDCYDEVQRYRLVNELSKYIPVDFYGRCGNLSCPRASEACNQKLSRYKFMIQFENSYCKDYISEKFWVAINQSVVPIVNWKPTQKDELLRQNLVPNHSYINIFDFPDLRTAANYIKRVNENEELYNSYFDWMKEYKTVDIGIWKQFCHLCHALFDPTIPAQSVKNLEQWIMDDTCKKGTPWSFLERRINRHIYDMGF